jgi:hypothetical protein
VKRIGKYRIKIWKDMENTEETQVELWNDMENMKQSKLKCEMIWKIFKESQAA